MARPMQPQPGLGEAIRELRGKSGLSQEELAHRAGVTTGTFSVIERGRSNPTWGTVKSIARALGVPLAELAAQAEKREPE